jgi:hypothetical protein
MLTKRCQAFGGDVFIVVSVKSKQSSINKFLIDKQCAWGI